MLKITTHAAADSTRITLEGRLAGPWVEELETCWRQAAEDPKRRTVIDLTDVTFIGAEGKALLTTMWQKGAELLAAGCCTKSIVQDITGKTGVPSARRPGNENS